ncbi:bifunctional serine/threonine-protein kinase/formylglycine-generating enzyme family protein, partial [Chamaesiphon sp. VAR_69_metabat_338]|uniref:bifunctional serine/threonine-protein kinase/formylglycine-generating enzyme family protein n=1 Tax=Chamaesiphon sp. VAR_69_metabat_338 TaxID=2964704 RepID=UPI00286D6B4A
LTMQPGQLLCDRYRIEKSLARGGFGETFLAVDTHLPSKPQVVVKLLKLINSDPETLKVAQRLFDTEAETLERLGKDNSRIPTLHAYFELRGEFYLVQEYIKGETLTAELQQRKISESDTIAILHEILTGLTTVYPNIHRDLKPDNIIRRDSDGKLVLIDFGAVKQVRAATVTTPNPAISRTIGIGTQGYMPSEQGIGYPKLASDIYAVGAIGIQCLTGSLPHKLFDEDSLSIEWQHLRQVNRDLAKVLDRMTAPDYRQRYANASEALDAIESLIYSPIPPTLPPQTPVSAEVTTNSVAHSLPSQPVESPVNQGIKPPPLKPIQQPVNKQIKMLLRGIDRRVFLKWLGLGGVGAASALALNRTGKKSSSNKSVSGSKTSKLTSNIPKLTKIQFTSIKLDRQGIVIDKPVGSAEIFTESLGNDVGLKMVKIPAGKFLMGSPEDEKDRQNDESPQHQVSVSEFYLGQTLVTQAQWLAIMGNNPAYSQGNDRLPVEQVSWLDAMDFCRKLSQKTGKTYRLPSEAEWEYACRAGTTSPFAFGETITPAVANYDGDSSARGADKSRYKHKTTPVGSFPLNLLGLSDLHGNLWEWCLDEWVDSYKGAPDDGSARGDLNSRDGKKRRVLRGGTWGYDASYCRSANREYIAASRRSGLIGFRVVCILSRTS